MVAEWSAECSAEDPVLVVPWSEAGGGAAYVDLRANPYDLYLIPEAEANPALMQALRSLNAARSPVFTAKCDAWALSEAETEALRFDLLADPESVRTGFGSYIDLLWRDRAVFTSRHRHEQLLDRLVRVLDAVDAPLAAVECVLRPAFLDVEEPQEGFAATLYVKAGGTDAEHAADEWGRALGEVVLRLRGREFATR